jgi:hypothetical protein
MNPDVVSNPSTQYLGFLIACDDIITDRKLMIQVVKNMNDISSNIWYSLGKFLREKFIRDFCTLGGGRRCRVGRLPASGNR